MEKVSLRLSASRYKKGMWKKRVYDVPGASPCLTFVFLSECIVIDFTD